MKTILASVLVLSALAVAPLPAFAEGGTAVRRSVHRTVRAEPVRRARPVEVRQAGSPTAAEGGRMFPNRGYGTQSSMDMIRDVQAASRSGMYTLPAHRTETPRELNGRLSQ